MISNIQRIDIIYGYGLGSVCTCPIVLILRDLTVELRSDRFSEPIIKVRPTLNCQFGNIKLSLQLI